MKLSPTMQDAIKYANEHGGKLVRYPGGYWTVSGHEMTRGISFGTSTIEALVKRNVAVYSEWKHRSGCPANISTHCCAKFPVEVTITHLVKM